LSTEKIITKSYQITVRNTKGIAINMNLYDQIPLSSDVNSKVVLTDAGNGNLEESTGQITWKINLKPKETKKITFTYTVTYPTNISLIVQ